MTYYAVFFGVTGLFIAVGGGFALYSVAKWFDRIRTPGAAIVFVLGGSGLMYAMWIGTRAAFTQQVDLALHPTFLFIPGAFALACVMELMRDRKKNFKNCESNSPLPPPAVPPPVPVP